MYADDTHLTFGSNTFAHLEENMNDDLTKITEWLNIFPVFYYWRWYYKTSRIYEREIEVDEGRWKCMRVDEG